MGKAPSEEELSRIALAIQAYPQDSISGARLGALIRAAAPELDIRETVGAASGAFTKFVDQFLSSVVKRVGHNPSDIIGGDWLFRKLPLPADTKQAVDADSSSNGQDYWVAYVKPSDSRSLVFDEISGNLGLRQDDRTELAPNFKIIEKVSIQEFRAISNEFIAGLKAKDSTRELAKKLELAGGYTEFVRVLKEAGYAYFNAWSVHRRGELRKLFLSRLDSLGLDASTKQRLLDALDESQVYANESIRQKTREAMIKRNSDQPVGSRAPTGDDITRRAIKEVIEKMSIAEIRALPIPFGYAMDAIQLSMQLGRPWQK